MNQSNPWMLIPLGIAALVMFGIFFGVNAASRRFGWSSKTRNRVLFAAYLALAVATVILNRLLIEGH